MPRVNTNIKKRYDGKRFYSSPDLPNIPTSNRDIYIVSDQTTKLDVLAYEYYKNPTYWWIIAKANNLGFGYSVKPGTQLRIPANIEKYI
jgi:hypothetical protein